MSITEYFYPIISNRKVIFGLRCKELGKHWN